MKKFISLFILCAILPKSCQNIAFEDSKHLTFLGLSFIPYVDANKIMPSNITDKNGKPLLSWRVDILKNAGSKEGELYKQFNLDEPWNSPHNLKVAQTVPMMYVDPKGPRCKPVTPHVAISVLMTMNPDKINYTPYLAVIGPKTAFSLGKLQPMDQGYAGVVVVDKSDVFWTEPRDISLEKVKQGDCLRWYKGDYTMYLTPRGFKHSWRKDGVITDQHDLPPKYEFESDD